MSAQYDWVKMICFGPIPECMWPEVQSRINKEIGIYIRDFKPFIILYKQSKRGDINYLVGRNYNNRFIDYQCYDIWKIFNFTHFEEFIKMVKNKLMPY